MATHRVAEITYNSKEQHLEQYFINPSELTLTEFVEEHRKKLYYDSKQRKILLIVYD